MSRIRRLNRDEVLPDVGEMFDRVAAQRGNIPNMFRAFAHRPEILKTMTAHMSTVLNSGTVSTKTKELVVTLVSRLNQCEY
ncbi:MAG: carboxymuconolactone decarboxylase family protein [Acidobacteria bacterium]|nr:carboxymuconolactone decarboxylase family protein [Acidobacteriota bacterium]